MTQHGDGNPPGRRRRVEVGDLSASHLPRARASAKAQRHAVRPSLEPSAPTTVLRVLTDVPTSGIPPLPPLVTDRVPSGCV